MAHGGSREGAGRPPLLDAWQRLGLGALVERRMDEARLDKAKKAFEKQLIPSHYVPGEDDDIQTVQRALKKLPVKRRKERARNPKPLGKGDGHVDRLVLDFQAVLKNWKKRSSVIPIRRLCEEERAEVLKQVAAEASQNYGVEITARMAQQALAEYRSNYAKELKDNDS